MKARIKKLKWAINRWFSRFRLPSLLTFKFYWNILVWPFKSMASVWKYRRTRNLLLGVPALVMFLVVAYFFNAVRSQASGISTKYWKQGAEATAKGNYQDAELLLERVLLENSGHQDDARFALALQYENEGQLERAASLFRLLAPDDKPGYRPAHRRLAILLCREINPQSSGEVLNRCHWHLKSALDDETPAMAMAWGQYSMAVGDYRAAKQYYMSAADEHPMLWKELGELESAFGNDDAARARYARAVDYYAPHLLKTPEDHASRIDYASVLLRLRRIDESRQLLNEGKRILPEESAAWNFMLANICLVEHEVMSEQGDPVEQQFAKLADALALDPNHRATLTRLMAYAQVSDADDRKALRSILEEAQARTSSPGLTHLALGNLSYVEGDKDAAALHFDLALGNDSRMPVVLNNLAWMISHDEDNPDYDRALEMINAALEQRPDNPSFLDTRGFIYLKQEKWKAALADLEKALPGVKDPVHVHENLATIYDNLKLPAIAEQHRLVVEESKKPPR